MSDTIDAMRADIRRHLRDSPVSLRTVAGLLARQYGLRSVLIYRLGQALLRHRRSLILWPLLLAGWLVYWPLAWLMRYGYGVDLRLSADIGPGLYIGHFGGIELVHCRLGAHCSIAQQTRIGRRTSGAGPYIGDRVWIGAHCRIEEAVRIGDGVTISAGSHVSRDIAEKALVAGNPARVTLREYDNSWLL